MLVSLQINVPKTSDVTGYIESIRRRLVLIGKQTAFNTVKDAADKHTRSGFGGTSGALLRSVQIENTPGGFRVFNDNQSAPHAIFVHDGTRPHLIPKFPMPHPVSKKQALHWIGKDRKSHFAKQVHHPGYMGHRWMQEALDKTFKAMKNAKL